MPSAAAAVTVMYGPGSGIRVLPLSPWLLGLAEGPPGSIDFTRAGMLATACRHRRIRWGRAARSARASPPYQMTSNGFPAQSASTVHCGKADTTAIR